MGVDLGDLAVKNTISLDSLSGKVIAIDAFNVLYQFLASIRQEDGTSLMDFRGNVTAHLSGLFYRSSKLIENGIKPVYVFDGERTKLKGAVIEKRVMAKKEAKKKWDEALAKGELGEAKKYAQATSRLTSEMVDESKELLDGMGIPWVQAKGEGEAEASIMVQKGKAYAAASQDYDVLLFGSPILVRNISITGRRKVDFNQGVYRIGPKTALKIVKEHKTLGEIEKYVKEKHDYEFEVNPREIFNLFTKPKKARLPEKFRWGNVKIEKIAELLVEKHDFSEERVQRTAEHLVKSFEEKGKQKNLDQWF